MKLKEKTNYLEITHQGSATILLGFLFVVVGTITMFVLGPGSTSGQDLLVLLAPVAFIVVGIVLVLAAKKTVIKLRKEGVSTVTSKRAVSRRAKEKSFESGDIIGVSVETGLQYNKNSASKGSRTPNQRDNFKTTTYYKVELDDGRSVPLGSKTKSGIWDNHIKSQIPSRIADYLHVKVLDNGVEKPVGMYRQHRLGRKDGLGRGIIEND